MTSSLPRPKHLTTHDLIPKIPTEHHELWPYGADQFARVPIMLERVKAWKGLVEELIHFFHAIVVLEENSAKEYQKGSRSFEHLRELGPFAGTNDMLRPLQQCLAKIANERLVLKQFVHDSILKKLDSTRTAIGHRYKEFKHAFQDLIHGILKHRTTTVQAITHHEKTSAKRLSLQQHPLSPQSSAATLSPSNSYSTIQHPPLNLPRTAMDPWLTERVLYAQLRRMVGAENTFQAQMVKMQEQLAAFDRWCVEEVKTILEDFAGIKGSSLNGIGAQISNLTTTLTAIPSESQFLNFSVRHLLTHPHTDLYTRPRSLPTFPYQVREIQIQRQGILYRPGAVRKNAWKPVVAVLTETGFLHIFDCSLSKVTRRVTSVGGVEGVGLGGGRMVLSGGDMCLEPRDWAPDGDGTDTASRRSSVSGSSVSESEGSGDREGMSPGTESHVYNNLDKPATRFSICLSQPRVTVGQSLNHQLTTVFTITVGAQPRRQSLVGGLMKSKQETRTYDLKAGSEEEMVEWVEILKRKIEQYIPEGPPAPFTHPTLSTASLPRQPSTTEAPLTDTTHRRHSLLRPKSPPPPPSLPLHNPSQTSDAVSIADSQEPEPHSSNLLLDTATAAMKTAMKGPSMVLDVAAAAMETAMAVGHLKQEKEGHDRAPRVGEPSPASLAAAAEGNTTTAEAAMVQQAPPVAV